MITALYLVGKINDSHIIFTLLIIFVNMGYSDSDLLMYLLSLGLFSMTWSGYFYTGASFYAHKPLAVRGQDK